MMAGRCDHRMTAAFSYVVILIVLFLGNVISQSAPKCVKWGNTFDVSLESKNVVLDCKKEDGRRVCCAAVNSTSDTRQPMSQVSRGVGIDYERQKTSGISSSSRSSSRDVKAKCETTKKYISSPQEIRDFEKALMIETIKDPQQKFDALLQYVTSAEIVRNSTTWLARVKEHMSSPHPPNANHIDKEFLSRFEITRKCGDEVDTWTEWIEPITITARHPFGFGRCRNTWQYYKTSVRAGRSDTDYVLLQSGASLYNHTHTGSGKRIAKRNNKHYLFDAGTSTFDSSLFWFTCGYSQRKISFDRVMGWEMTYLEPRDYWSRVPANWKPYWTFFNVPISPDPKHPDSPVRLLKSIATPADFVSFKLDIDHPDTEMPIALSLLSDPVLAEIVDEFFFELHFQCDVMTSCGWGKRVPPTSHGLILDRPHVLQFFLDVRKKGIRAHIWP